MMVIMQACCEHGGMLSLVMTEVTAATDTVIWNLPITRPRADSYWHEAQVAIIVSPDALFCVLLYV